jgi:hypothetical protein
MWGPSGPIRFAFRPGTMKVSAAVLLCVLGWPLCGSQDSEDMSWNSTWEKTGGNHPIGVASRPGKVSAVLTQLRDTAIGSSGSAQIPGKLSSGVKILAPKSPNATLQKAGASRILVYATSNAALQMPSASQGRTRRRGLQSSALRTLRNFAELVLPQTLAILPRVFTEMVAQKGDEREEQEFASWFEAYVCLLHKAQRRLDDERMWHAELEQKENATMQSDMRQCRSDLARIQQRRATAAQDAAAILHNLRLWQRIQSSSAESTSDSEERARADGHIQRLKAEQLRHSLDTRGLEVLLCTFFYIISSSCHTTQVVPYCKSLQYGSRESSKLTHSVEIGVKCRIASCDIDVTVACFLTARCYLFRSFSRRKR